MASSFVCGRRVHHHDRAGRAGLPRGVRDTECGVAGADRPDAVGELIGRQLADDVERAANLERADRLEHFELEVELEGPSGRAGQLHADERRADRAARRRLWPRRGSRRWKCARVGRRSSARGLQRGELRRHRVEARQDLLVARGRPASAFRGEAMLPPGSRTARSISSSDRKALLVRGGFEFRDA